MENPEGRGGHTANPFRGGGMDIFWNHTLFNMFKLDCTAFQAMLCFLTRLIMFILCFTPAMHSDSLHFSLPVTGIFVVCRQVFQFANHCANFRTCA